MDEAATEQSSKKEPMTLGTGVFTPERGEFVIRMPLSDAYFRGERIEVIGDPTDLVLRQLYVGAMTQLQHPVAFEHLGGVSFPMNKGKMDVCQPGFNIQLVIYSRASEGETPREIEIKIHGLALRQ